jgi:hypothetical protein
MMERSRIDLYAKLGLHPLKGCRHGRQCKECPRKILTEISELLGDAGHLFEILHYEFDGITVDEIHGGSGLIHCVAKKFVKSKPKEDL